jgi:hypothetical protein
MTVLIVPLLIQILVISLLCYIMIKKNTKKTLIKQINKHDTYVDRGGARKFLEGGQNLNIYSPFICALTCKIKENKF